MLSPSQIEENETSKGASPWSNSFQSATSGRSVRSKPGSMTKEDIFIDTKDVVGVSPLANSSQSPRFQSQVNSLLQAEEFAEITIDEVAAKKKPQSKKK